MITIIWPAEPKPPGEGWPAIRSLQSGGWGPWSDSHRRLRVYETRPVAAEAQGQEEKAKG